MSYSLLKSGTDIRGIANEFFGEKITLTDEAISDITNAFVCFLSNKYNKNTSQLTIAVGHDSRVSADRISASVISALTKSGVKVFNCSMSSTPAMFMAIVELGCDASVQITASHHPADRNGLKFFLKDGGIDSATVSEILSLADKKAKVVSETLGNVIHIDFMKRYAEMLREKICSAVGKTESQQPLKNYKIIVDAGNGAGGFFATEVLEKLGADISGSQFLNPDGMFPNHIPNPENQDAMHSLKDAVIKNKADLGIIFDTDVDRAGCVDNIGEEINRNRLIALAAKIVSNTNKGATIVTDSVTSDGLKEFINNELGCVLYRYKRGYRNVIDKAKQLCDEGIDCPLAIETSGHAALRENYFLDDGAYLVTKIIIELAKGIDISKALLSLKNPLEEKEYRLEIMTEDFKVYGQHVIDELEKHISNIPSWSVDHDNQEGIRVVTETGWFLLRLSVHDPVMPVNLESYSEGGIKRMLDVLVPFLIKMDKLQFSID